MSTSTAITSGTSTPMLSPSQATAGATPTPPPLPATEANIIPNDIAVKLQYLKDDPLYDRVKPLQITPTFADKDGRTNVQLMPGAVEVIRDVRGLDHSFSLDENGFVYVKAPTAFKEWSSQPRIAQDYLPELEELLKREVEGCDEIMFYDARLRQSGDEGLRVEGLSYNPFARQVHVDNTAPSVVDKIHNLTELKADYLLSGRARIINIWRPIKHPVYDCGLAIADAGKLLDSDVIECDRVKASTLEFWDTMGVAKYRPGFDWYYCSLQGEEDVLLFKGYDSATDVKARHCLHTAFDLPADMVPEGAPTRESIEVRALVFTYPANQRRPSSASAVPHPLAVQLQQGNLKRIDEEHSLTDRVRTDIDEADEVKDAVLLLRRQEIRRLNSLNAAVVSERDDLYGDLMKANSERDRAQTELMRAQKLIVIQTPQIQALEAEVKRLHGQLSHSHSDLRKHNYSTSRELTDMRLREATRAQEESAGFSPDSHSRDAQEKQYLLQTIQRQEHEIQQWKCEAMGCGSVAVSRSWQGSVDEAVRREREKDAFVVDALRREIEQLKHS
ncbi:hypothetical protein LTR08_003879 [Meristemomyces frigidus]|nr:hypothetical protein LTR08_003879 [Meristemomyces frigidus]